MRVAGGSGGWRARAAVVLFGTIAVVFRADPSAAQLCAYATAPSQIVVVNVEAQAIARRFDLAFDPLDVALTPDGRFLYVARAGGVLTQSGTAVIATVIDLADGTLTNVRDACDVDGFSAQCSTTDLAATDDGGLVVAVGTDAQCTCPIGGRAEAGDRCEVAQRLTLIDTATKSVRRMNLFDFGPIGGFLGPNLCAAGLLRSDVAISPGGVFAFVTDAGRDTFDAGRVSVVHLPTGQRLTIEGGTCPGCDERIDVPVAVALPATDDAWIANTQGLFGTPSLSRIARDTFELREGTLVLDAPAPFAMAVEPGRPATLLVTRPGPPLSPSGRLLTFVDAASGDVQEDVELPAHPFDVAFTPDGAVAVLSTTDDEGSLLAFFDTRTKRVRATLPLGELRRPESVTLARVANGCPVPPTPTPTATPTPIPVPCFGDCDDSGRVTANEIVRGVRIGLGAQPLAACLAFDRDGDGSVGVDELIRAVTASLRSCRGRCFGDCDGDGAVGVDELIRAVNVALLRRPLADCPALDADRSGTVTVDELTLAVRAALAKCVGQP